jgi:hypothetical protein
MPSKYLWRKDLSKYTLKTFDSANEYVCDTNNSDIVTVNRNGTQVTLQDSGAASASSSPIEIIGGTAAGSGTSAYTLVKTVTAVADNVATAVATVTIPNPTVNANATFLIQVCGVMGAGGAVGAGESTAGSAYVMSVARTVGATAVVTTSSQTASAVSKVSGGDTFACTIAASSVSGGSTATETFTITATAHDSTGSGTNHVVTVVITLLNGATGGVSIA